MARTLVLSVVGSGSGGDDDDGSGSVFVANGLFCECKSVIREKVC